MPDLTVDVLVRRHAETHPTKPAVVDPDTTMAYRDLDDSSRALAAVLVEAGVVKGTRVGLLMPNNVGWVQTAVAITRIGAVLVPLSTLLAPRELLAQLRTAAVQVLITVEEFRGHRYLDDLGSEIDAPMDVDQPMFTPQLPALRRIWTPQLLSTAAAPAAADIVDALTAAVTPSDLLAVMFTSGSSGPPKGVLHSHGNALAAVAAGLHARCIDADTRLYLPMPFFWVGGFGSGVLSALIAGATLVTEPIPRPAARTGAGNAVPGLAGSSGGAGKTPRQHRCRPVVVTARQPRGAAAGRSAGPPRCPRQPVRDDRVVRPVLRLPR